jgi:hypothetical protein
MSKFFTPIINYPVFLTALFFFQRYDNPNPEIINNNKTSKLLLYKILLTSFHNTYFALIIIIL